MSTRGRSPAWQIRRVASIPSRRGIRTSITTTSAVTARSKPSAAGAVAGLADHRHVRLRVEHHAEAGPHQLLVVDEQDADASCGARPHRG